MKKILFLFPTALGCFTVLLLIANDAASYTERTLGRIGARYYSIPAELTALFRPLIYNKEYILQPCIGEILLGGKRTKYEEPFACNYINRKKEMYTCYQGMMNL